MTNREKVPPCRCCGSTELETLPALEAAFVARYALGRLPQPAVCCACATCGFRSFWDGYTREEESRLYGEYRGPAYLAARRFAEPWYTQRINDGIGADPDEISRRCARVAGMLGSVVDLEAVQTVIDYGGDRGQFIPPNLGRERFVLEVSNALSVPGVTRIQPMDDRCADIVLCCHVLEHATAPDGVLMDIVSRYLEDDGTIYIEVPREQYDLRFVPLTGMVRTFYEAYLRAVAHSRIAYTIIDFYSTVSRIKLNIVPPFGFLKKHEHINFFSAESLSRLMRRCGLQVLTSSLVEDMGSRGFSHVLIGLGRKQKSSLPRAMSR